ncbi:MAG: hypothetical protein COA88_12750 [Kordia sp.]|nr:MAG: hypothetical protein COA88_12750 [Kordia sp.]
MEIEYKIEENDFLDFQLFTASKSERIMKKKKNGWLLITIGSLIFGIYFYLQNNYSMTIYFGLSTVIWGLFYPKYFNWRHKKHYAKYVKENYNKRFGEVEKLKITEEYIYSEDKIGEGKIKLKEIDEVSETQKHFILKISTGMSLIIPKREIENVDLLRTELKMVGLNIIDELNWQWK